MKYIKNNFLATSVIEAVIVMFIVVSGVVGMYQVFGNSQKLSNSTSNKITAIQIAREGIEAMKNIRDTNWVLFASDKDNCWNVWDYDNSCVGDDTDSNDISDNVSYILYNSNSKWFIDSKNGIGEYKYSNTNYRTAFKVGLNSEGFFTQSGAVTEIKPLFTREIKIKYLKADGTIGDSNDPKMEVTSLVQWVDNSTSNVQKVEFTSILTNWKK